MTAETLSQTAYRRIKQDILEGRIAPDSMLSERELALRLGISRTPLRSALSRLENENVIGRFANGALIVRSVTVEQLLEIVQLRQVLERAAAARAAERGMTDDLRRVWDEMLPYAEGRSVGFDEFWQVDEGFHAGVARAAGLELLPAILAEQRAVARRCTITRVHDRFDEQAREHIAVLDAIARGDAPAARDAMSLHFENVRNRFLGWFSKG